MAEDLLDGDGDGDYVELRKAIKKLIDKPDGANYDNLHCAKIRGYKEQAAGLHGYFKTLVSHTLNNRENKSINST